MNQTRQWPDDPVPGPGEYRPALFQLPGRLGRMRYFVYLTAVSVVVMGFFSLLMLVVNIGGTAEYPDVVLAIGVVAGAIAVLIILVASVLFGVRRLNDLNASGWLMVLMLVPLLNLVLGLVLLLVPGSVGANRFGPPAMANSPGLRAAMYTLILMLLGWGGLFSGVYYATFMTPLESGQHPVHSISETAQGERF